MLNRGGASYMVEIDPMTESILCSLYNTGADNHGLVTLDENFFLSLSSSSASLVKIRIPKYCNKQRLQADVTTIWTYSPQSVWEKIQNIMFKQKKFLKGLAVLNDVAVSLLIPFVSANLTFRSIWE